MRKKLSFTLLILIIISTSLFSQFERKTIWTNPDFDNVNGGSQYDLFGDKYLSNPVSFEVYRHRRNHGDLNDLYDIVAVADKSDNKIFFVKTKWLAPVYHNSDNEISITSGTRDFACWDEFETDDVHFFQHMTEIVGDPLNIDLNMEDPSSLSVWNASGYDSFCPYNMVYYCGEGMKSVENTSVMGILVSHSEFTDDFNINPKVFFNEIKQPSDVYVWNYKNPTSANNFEDAEYLVFITSKLEQKVLAYKASYYRNSSMISPSIEHTLYYEFNLGYEPGKICVTDEDIYISTDSDRENLIYRYKRKDFIDEVLSPVAPDGEPFATPASSISIGYGNGMRAYCMDTHDNLLYVGANSGGNTHKLCIYNIKYNSMEFLAKFYHDLNYQDNDAPFSILSDFNIFYGEMGALDRFYGDYQGFEYFWLDPTITDIYVYQEQEHNINEFESGYPVGFTYTLTGTSYVTASVYNSNGTGVAKLRDEILQEGGTYTIAWDGMVGDLPAPSGDYKIYIKANDIYGDNTLENTPIDYLEKSFRVINSTTGRDHTPPPKSRMLMHKKDFSAGNFPNPFNGSTTINFSIPESGEVSVGIYNIKGQLVKKLADKSFMEAGSHNIVWNTTNNGDSEVSSGVYFYKIQHTNKEIVKRTLFIK